MYLTHDLEYISFPYNPLWARAISILKFEILFLTGLLQQRSKGLTLETSAFQNSLRGLI